MLVIAGQKVVFRMAPLLPGSIRTLENFVRIGHSLLALMAAFLGGHLSRYIDSRRSGARQALRVLPSAAWRRNHAERAGPRSLSRPLAAYPSGAFGTHPG